MSIEIQFIQDLWESCTINMEMSEKMSICLFMRAFATAFLP